MLLNERRDLHIDKCRDNPAYFMGADLKVLNEAKELVRFGRLFPGPQRFQEHVDDCVARRRPVRLLICKARRHRMTTQVQANFMHRLLLGGRNLNCVTVSKNQTMTDDIMLMQKTFHGNLPDWYRPELRADKPDEMWLDLRSRKAQINQKQRRLNNRIRAWTAEGGSRGKSSGQKAGGLGRGASIDLCHLSEIAFYPNCQEIMDALNQSFASGRHTMVVKESTANGMGGHFYEQFVRAINGESKTWSAIFIPWYDHPEYRGSFLASHTGLEEYEPDDHDIKMFEEFKDNAREGFENQANDIAGAMNLDEYERELALAHPVDWDQILWRRWCIDEKCDGNVHTLKVEFPATWQEAFAASGTPRFNNNRLYMWIEQHKECQPTPTKLTIDKPEGWDPLRHGRIEPEISCEHLKGSAFHVLIPPMPEHSYVIAADAATGVGQDASAFAVLDRNEERFVAYYRDQFTPPDVLAERMIEAGWYYNHATLCAETNLPGNYTQGLINESGYGEIYFRQHLDVITKSITRSPGWQTTLKTRSEMIAKFARFIQKTQIPIEINAICEEGTTFALDAKRNPPRAEHLEGCNDDLLFAAMIAYRVHSLLMVPRNRRALEEEDVAEIPPGWHRVPDEDLSTPERGARLRRRMELLY